MVGILTSVTNHSATINIDEWNHLSVGEWINWDIGSNFADAVEAPLCPGAHPVPPLAGVVQVLPHEHAFVMLPTKTLLVRLALKIGILKNQFHSHFCSGIRLSHPRPSCRNPRACRPSMRRVRPSELFPPLSRCPRHAWDERGVRHTGHCLSGGTRSL